MAMVVSKSSPPQPFSADVLPNASFSRRDLSLSNPCETAATACTLPEVRPPHAQPLPPWHSLLPLPAQWAEQALGRGDVALRAGRSGRRRSGATLPFQSYVIRIGVAYEEIVQIWIDNQ